MPSGGGGLSWHSGDVLLVQRRSCWACLSHRFGFKDPIILQDAEDNRGGAFLERITLAEGVVDPSAMAKVLGITKRRLAEAVGLPADAVHRKSRMYSGSTQAPLKELAEFMGLIVAWHESPAAAFRWYVWHPLFSFGGRSPEDVFKAEGVAALETWVGQIEAGVYI